MSDPFFEEGSRLLTPHAFEFVLDGELKRAVRSQNFLTLVVLETSANGTGMTVTADDGRSTRSRRSSATRCATPTCSA